MLSDELEFNEFSSRAQTAPDEVLLKIFEHLQLTDRLAVRQVCRKWFAVCQDKRFQVREKYSIEKLYKNYVDNVLQFFTEVNRECLNFEFNGLSFNNEYPHFWKTCGPRIYSLNFNECELSLETFSHIVTNCTSLQQLTLGVCNHKFVEFVGERNNETRELDLRALIDKGCVNTSVKSVTLHFRGLKHQWSRLLVQILQLFPNMKRFVFVGSEFTWDYEVMDPANLAAINEVLFDNNLEDLRLVTYTYQYRELDWTVLATKSHLTMLTEVAVHVNDRTDKHLLTSFLSRQANLKTLHFLSRTTTYSDIMDEAFDVIFKHCRHLNTLEWISSRRLFWGSMWFKLLAESSVTSLKIECDDIVFPNVCVYPPNSNMQRLEVQFKSYFTASTLPLIEAFPFLRVFKIFKVTEKIMHAVLELQKHLVVFSARFKARLVFQSRYNSDEMFKEVKNDLDSRPLDFSDLRVERLIMPADVAKRPNFLSHSLKYLRLRSPMGEVYYNPIALDTEMSPLLEEVIIETSCFSYPLRGSFPDNILKFIRPLKKLRYMYLTSRTRLVHSSDMPYLSDDFVREVFQRCPLLRCFVYKRIYFRNNLNRGFLIVADVDESLSRTSAAFTYKNECLPRIGYTLQL